MIFKGHLCHDSVQKTLTFFLQNHDHREMPSRQKFQVWKITVSQKNKAENAGTVSEGKVKVTIAENASGFEN